MGVVSGVELLEGKGTRRGGNGEAGTEMAGVLSEKSSGGGMVGRETMEERGGSKENACFIREVYDGWAMLLWPLFTQSNTSRIRIRIWSDQELCSPMSYSR